MWTVEFLPEAIEEEAELPLDMQANLGRMTKVIGDRGLLDLPPGWIKPLGNKLWELRITGRDGIARAIHIAMKEQRLVIVRIFIKKTQKTPAREIAIARRRAKEVE
jgi:phage-related protein